MLKECEIPVVVCTVDGNTWIIACPYCGQKHHHTPGEGHRVAFCYPRGSYSFTLPDGKTITDNEGYFLKIKKGGDYSYEQ